MARKGKTTRFFWFGGDGFQAFGTSVKSEKTNKQEKNKKKTSEKKKKKKIILKRWEW